MNVLIVTQYFWPESFRINDLADGLCKRGHRVTVYTGLPNYPGGRFFPGYSLAGPYTEERNGMRILRVPLVPRGGGGRLRLALNYFSHAVCATLLAALRCPREVDVVLVYEPSPVTIGLPAVLVKRLRRAPLLFWVQDLWPQSLEATGAVRSRTMLAAVERLVRWIYRRCDRVLVQSRGFAAPVARQGVPEDRIVYFPNSAEPLYGPRVVEPAAPEHAELPAGFVVMFAGNIGAAQDFPTILEAAGRLRGYDDIHWVVFGDGRMKEWVVREVEARGLAGRVHLLGQRPAEAMPRFFALADALLVTLRREPIFSFTIPSKIQSYLACGRPVIAALDGEGARVVEEAGAGYAVPPEDPAALAAAVLRMRALDAAGRAAMGERGIEYFARCFDRNRLLDQLETLMRQVTGKA